MLHDAHDLPSGAVLEADICIVGAGPAGIAIALELARRGVDTCVLEGGGTEPDPAAQSLHEGTVRGDHYPPLAETRWRQLCGTTHLWNTRLGPAHGFRAAPLDAIDFERRDWAPYSGWPFGLEHLEPYYRRAQEFCALGPYAYGGASWETPEGPQLKLDPAVCNTSVWQFTPRERFTEGLRAEMERSPRAAVWLHANVTELETNETAGEVSRVHAATPEGKAFSVRARTVVLATGGIENARILLLSNRVQEAGIGNGHDLVGRYFMEHQVVSGGILTPRDRALLDTAALYDERPVNGTWVMGQIRFTEELMRRERLLNLSFALYPRHPRHERIRTEAIHSFEALARSVLRLRPPAEVGRHLREVLRSADFVAASMLRKASGQRLFRYFVPGPDLVSGDGWSALPDKQRRFGAFAVLLHTEQLPHPDNRVVLSEERDRLGCRRPELQWRWRDEDRESVARAQRIFADEVERAGIGSYAPLTDDEGQLVLRASGLHHHMGTTRMHPDPKQGVVDADARVHGVGNLYVAGCSVFPTGGYINPTLTIVAMALRLADHLADRARSTPAVEASTVAQES
ncbi:MAG TPA: GMC family oxidoreductase [Longimicrobiaceae bacterium]|nr:GMC family oxidoreductase [Longimicrobiaceae bacterium]